MPVHARILNCNGYKSRVSKKLILFFCQFTHQLVLNLLILCILKNPFLCWHLYSLSQSPDAVNCQGGQLVLFCCENIYSTIYIDYLKQFSQLLVCFRPQPHLHVPGEKEGRGSVLKAHSVGHPLKSGDLRCKRAHMEPNQLDSCPGMGVGVRKKNI